MMNLRLFHYFFGYIFKSKTRQKLIFLAIVGLIISSFSLTVLQGVMGGLQNGLMARSKKVLGKGYIDLQNIENDQIETIEKVLLDKEIEFSKELELELLIEHEGNLVPTIAHGVDFSAQVPEFLQNVDKTHIVLGSELGRKLRTYFGARLNVISPGHTILMFKEVPRQGITLVSDYYSSQLPEIDGVHSWVRIGFLQNLIRKRVFNKLRIYSDLKNVQDLTNDFPFIKLISWEEEHSALVWALNLETKVMLFLFIGMSFLIGICITSGLIIFYDKIKIDLASFWILGLSRDKVMILVNRFSHFLTIFFCLAGVGLGIGFLLLLDNNTIVLMPDEFIERNIPVKFESIQILISFLVPYLIAVTFTYFTFRIFKKENHSFIKLIRKVG